MSTADAVPRLDVQQKLISRVLKRGFICESVLLKQQPSRVVDRRLRCAMGVSSKPNEHVE